MHRYALLAEIFQDILGFDGCYVGSLKLS